MLALLISYMIMVTPMMLAFYKVSTHGQKSLTDGEREKERKSAAGMSLVWPVALLVYLMILVVMPGTKASFKAISSVPGKIFDRIDGQDKVKKVLESRKGIRAIESAEGLDLSTWDDEIGTPKDGLMTAAEKEAADKRWLDAVADEPEDDNDGFYKRYPDFPTFQPKNYNHAPIAVQKGDTLGKLMGQVEVRLDGVVTMPVELNNHLKALKSELKAERDKMDEARAKLAETKAKVEAHTDWAKALNEQMIRIAAIPEPQISKTRYGSGKHQWQWEETTYTAYSHTPPYTSSDL